MGIYIFNLVGIFFYAVMLILLRGTNKEVINSQYQNKGIGLNDLIIFFISLQLFLISAFRSVNVGIDLSLYVERFNIISFTEWKDLFQLRNVVDFEYGYILFNKIVSVLFYNEQVLIVVTSFIVIFSFSYFIRNYSKIPWLSFYLFITLGFYGGSFNILRQYIAMSILVFSIKYIKKRNPLKFLSFLALAVSFHTTAIVFIILYPLYKIKINKMYITLLVFVGLIIGFTANKIITLVFSYTPYSSYIEDIGSTGSGEGMLMVLLFVVICMLIFKKSIKKSDRDNTNLWFHMIIIAIFFNILALNLGIFERIMRYFMIGLIIAIPNTIYSLKQKDFKSIGIIAVLFLCTYYYFGIIMTGFAPSGGILPYEFMWE